LQHDMYPVEGCIIVTDILLIRKYVHFLQAVGNFSSKNIGQSKGQNQ